MTSAGVLCDIAEDREGEKNDFLRLIGGHVQLAEWLRLIQSAILDFADGDGWCGVLLAASDEPHYKVQTGMTVSLPACVCVRER